MDQKRTLEITLPEHVWNEIDKQAKQAALSSDEMTTNAVERYIDCQIRGVQRIEAGHRHMRELPLPWALEKNDLRPDHLFIVSAANPGRYVLPMSLPVDVAKLIVAAVNKV